MQLPYSILLALLPAYLAGAQEIMRGTTRGQNGPPGLTPHQPCKKQCVEMYRAHCISYMCMNTTAPIDASIAPKGVPDKTDAGVYIGDHNEHAAPKGVHDKTDVGIYTAIHDENAGPKGVHDKTDVGVDTAPPMERRENSNNNNDLEKRQPKKEDCPKWKQKFSLCEYDNTPPAPPKCSVQKGCVFPHGGQNGGGEKRSVVERLAPVAVFAPNAEREVANAADVMTGEGGASRAALVAALAAGIVGGLAL